MSRYTTFSTDAKGMHPRAGAPCAPVLRPDDLRMIARVFEAALCAIDETTCRIDAYSARQALARYIMERALRGERDPERLKEGALEHLLAAVGLPEGDPAWLEGARDGWS
jgi:hypothetical protein